MGLSQKYQFSTEFSVYSLLNLGRSLYIKQLGLELKFQRIKFVTNPTNDTISSLPDFFNSDLISIV